MKNKLVKKWIALAVAVQTAFTFAGTHATAVFAAKANTTSWRERRKFVLNYMMHFYIIEEK